MNSTKSWISTAGLAIAYVLAGVGLSAAADDATRLRVFLRDGASLVSYGEFARVADRVVFSMPTAATEDPPLQLVNIPAERVDWDRTNRYAESARANRYFATQAEIDYAELGGILAKTLNDVASVSDAAGRLSLVENARKTLAEWSQNHFNYRQTDVQQMLSMLDEAIADLRVAAGGARFDLSLIAVANSPAALEPLLPPPTPAEAIEQVLSAARVTDSSAERQILFNVAIVALNRDLAALPPQWAAATRAKTMSAIEEENRVDRAYHAMVRRLIGRAERRAKQADVRGVLQVLDLVRSNDAALGRKRPDEVTSAIAAVESHLDAARQLRLARDRWSIRAPVLRQYSEAVNTPLGILQSVEDPLKDIKELAGSSQDALTLLRRQVKAVVLLLGTVMPPDECRPVHALLASAAQLADTAAQIRREAAVSGDVTRAWDASAAAAGALMLSARARTEIQTLLRPPQLQ